MFCEDHMASSSWSRSLYVDPCGESSSSYLRTLDDEDDQHSPSWDMSDSASDAYLSPSQRDHSHPAQHSIKSELIEVPDCRILRPSTVLPRPTLYTSTSSEVAIQAQHYNPNNSSSQDVHHFVKTSASYLSSPATRSDAFSNYLGPSVSSSPAPSQHVLTTRRSRPRTSNQVFTSSHGSIAPHGLPASLPPAPSTAPRRTHKEPQRTHSALTDFQSMSANYLNMLKHTNNTMTDSTSISTVAPADLGGFGPADLQGIIDVVTATAASTMLPPPTPDTPALDSSPAWTDFGDFGDLCSPDLDDPLNTPLISDGDMLSGMIFESEFMGGDLFPAMDYAAYTVEKPASSNAPTLPDNLYTFTPESPMLHDFSPTINPSSLYPSPRLPSDLHSFPAPTQSTAAASQKNLSRAVADQLAEIETTTRRRSSATGTRKGVTPEALVPIDAPTQPRKYLTPSATSRREVPSVFAKKRSRSTAFGADEDDEFNEPPLPPNATELEQIEYKRRQNTVAARRSRKRKLEYQQKLEDEVDHLKSQVEKWRTRATMCQDMLHAAGVPFTFQDPVEED